MSGAEQEVALPAALVEALAVVPEAGEWHPVHQLLTAGEGAPAVCLLSSVEIRVAAPSGPAVVDVVARSTRAAANLAARPLATLVCWAEGLHYLDLELRDHAEQEGAQGYRFVVRGLRTDDIGIPMRPLQYEMDARLVAAERWDLTRSLFERLGGLD